MPLSEDRLASLTLPLLYTTWKGQHEPDLAS
jgi:hypothetical protein